MGRFTERLKTAFRRKKQAPHVPPKQIDRWEGEGGALHPEDEHHEPQQRRQDRPQSPQA